MYSPPLLSIAVIKHHYQEAIWEPGVVVHAFNPSTWEAEAEAGGFLSSRPAWSTK
jgi:major histocompatibility complex class I